jgi:hypothetical protein
MSLLLIGPFAVDIAQLREDWHEWVENNQETISQIREQAEKDAKRLRMDEGQAFQYTIQAVAAALGDREQVTPPNLASIMFLVKEGEQKILLTGDGHGDDILKGLRLQKEISDEEGIHLDILKVQHHGSEFNLDDEFCRWVTADHYVFCGNGAHENPDERVIQTIINSRTGSEAGNSKSPDVNKHFTLWFNSSKEATTSDNYKKHMASIEKLVDDLRDENSEKFDYFFLRDQSHFEISLG